MSEENIKLLKKAGLKITEPRLTILALMQEHKHEHFSAEEVYKILLEQGSDIGLATVYRVLNQFNEAHIQLQDQCHCLVLIRFYTLLQLRNARFYVLALTQG